MAHVREGRPPTLARAKLPLHFAWGRAGVAPATARPWSSWLGDALPLGAASSLLATPAGIIELVAS